MFPWQGITPEPAGSGLSPCQGKSLSLRRSLFLSSATLLYVKYPLNLKPVLYQKMFDV